MSKRAVSFADSIETRSISRVVNEEVDIDEYDPPEQEARPSNQGDEDDEPSGKKSKHTLDSDEELEDDHDKMDIKNVEGQEDCELDFDGTTKITAFNMKEDMEEGHFDASGNFIYDKKEKETKDAWLDDIDWGSVKKRAGDQWEKDQEGEDDDVAAPGLTESRRREIFTELIAALLPGQTVAKALTSIKKKKVMTAAEERKLRWAAKKAGTAVAETDEQKAANKLSGLADELLTAGHMEAYEWPRERIEHLLSQMDSLAVDTLDMFGDEPAPAASSGATAGGASTKDTSDDEVTWEYKESDDGPVQGPFTSSEMAARQDRGDLADKGVARKNGSGSFNPVARIDFDIYC